MAQGWHSDASIKSGKVVFKDFLSQLDTIASKHSLACFFYFLWFFLFLIATVILGYFSNDPVCRYLFPILSLVTRILDHWSRAWKHFAFHKLCMQYKMTFNYDIQFPRDAIYAKTMIDSFQTARLSLTDVPGKNNYKWPYFLFISLASVNK